MIVEFTGCSGAGKSTLCRSAYRSLAAEGREPFTPLEVVFGRRLARWVPTDRLAYLLLDPFAVCWFLRDRVRYRDFYSYAHRIVHRETDGRLHRLLLLRSVIRKLGLFSLLTRPKHRDKLVLFDEGTVHAAHVIFVNGGGTPDDEDIARFTGLVPCPDAVVFVRSDRSELIRRTFDRRDKPIRGAGADTLSDFIGRAATMFEQLFATGFMQGRCLHIDNTCDGEGGREKAIRQTVDFIQDAMD